MLLKSEADAEDVAQDVFCKLWLQPELWLDNDKRTRQLHFHND